MCSCNRGRLLLMMLEGEISPQSCLLFRCGPRESLFPFFFLRKPRWERGGYFCPRGQLWWILYRLIHPVRRPWAAFLLIHQNANLRNSNSTACGWLDSICSFFNKVQIETYGPLRNSCRLFSLKIVQGCTFFFFYLGPSCNSSWLFYGWGAQDETRVTHVSTCAACCRDETLALQLALITRHHQQQSSYNEKHISYDDRVITFLPCHTHSPW